MRADAARTDFLVVGGGMAGASAGYFLAPSGGVTVVEMEAIPGYHSTSRSAAVFSEYYGNSTVRSLTAASRSFYLSPPAGFTTPLVTPRGVLALCPHGADERFAEAFAAGLAAPTPVRELDPVEVRHYCPAVRPDWFSRAMFKPAAMDIDVDAVHQGFLSGIRAHGGRVLRSARLRSLVRRGGSWEAVTDAGEIRAEYVVNAGGAWADEVAGLAGVRRLGLTPLRRTAFIVAAPDATDVTHWPMVDDVTETFYFKPESGRLLISPADATPVQPGDARPDDEDVARAIDRVQMATTLVIRHVQRAWAGLRTAAPDDTPVIGEAPDAPGFFWQAGLSGYGIQTAPAAGRLLAALVTGGQPPAALTDSNFDLAAIAPARLLLQKVILARRAPADLESIKYGHFSVAGLGNVMPLSNDTDLPLDRAVSFAGRAVDYGEFRAVPRLIEDTVDRFPDRVAVCHADRTMTYRQLDQFANGIAVAAADRGVVKGDRVATLLGNSLEMPAVYLAMMKLGAAFVPMDPGWPPERLQTTLRVLSPRLILCADAGQVPAEFRGLGTPVAIEMASAPPGCSIGLDPRRPEVPLGPGDLCYGFFTSGTTGTPKCALNRHGGLANRLRFMTRWFAAGDNPPRGAMDDDVVLQNSKHTFDSSLWQLLWPLTTGGRTVLPEAGEFLNLQATIDTIAEHRVTTTDFVSSIFNALVAIIDGDELAQRKLASLRYLIVGSEEINPRAVHRMRAMLPHVRITNGYGPTETSIGMVFHLITDADGDAIPIGKPIDNCYVAVLADDGTPAPQGATGEIAIGGACVGAGYHGDEAATDKAFVPNSFPGRIPGDRLYLSGDFGYLDEQGRLFFSGRKDFQVKIGGVRIELGEIETAAQQCPGVYQAKALVAERDGIKSLAVFAAGIETLSPQTLRDHLRRTLPRTSVPRYCLVLPRMPLTEGGKVNWRELRAMLESRLDADAEGLAATGPASVASGESWPGLTLRAFRIALGQPDLSADTDFMEAGGDSLRALIAVRMLSDECGVPDLCVLDLIEQPTARQLAELIATREPSTQAAAAEAEQMERDATLGDHPVIRSAGPPGKPTEPRTVLVTGATGFVGSRLVHDLLAATDLRVLCLARAESDTDAAERVAGALAERGLWEPRFADRLDGYAGNLGEANLGLADAAWDHLARSCDLVVHNGALVNLLFSYAAHRPANVLGTAEILRLAMTARPVPVHYVSTLSAVQAQAMRRTDRLPEQDPSATVPPARGYSRSKWVAERYLGQARRRGASVTVLRLGEVLPSEQRPHPNTRALTHLLLSAIGRLGVAPDAEIRSDYTPVDYATARIVAAVLDRDAWGRTLHVFHPDSVDFAGALTVERTSCAGFLARLREAAEQTGDPELAGLAALLPGANGRAPGSEPNLRRELAALLTDNPSLYRKDECRRLEDRWQLTDPDLSGPIAAYHEWLGR